MYFDPEAGRHVRQMTGRGQHFVMIGDGQAGDIGNGSFPHGHEAHQGLGVSFGPVFENVVTAEPGAGILAVGRRGEQDKLFAAVASGQMTGATDRGGKDLRLFARNCTDLLHQS